MTARIYCALFLLDTIDLRYNEWFIRREGYTEK
jgi:hypothetical protein